VLPSAPEAEGVVVVEAVVTLPAGHVAILAIVSCIRFISQSHTCIAFRISQCGVLRCRSYHF